jgi:LAGLIDADG endonuclease
VDCLLLSRALSEKFKIEARVVSTGSPSKYILTIRKEFFDKIEHITSSSIFFKFMKYKIVNNRSYSTRSLSHSSILSQFKISNSLKFFQPSFITGFSDAEVSFMILINNNSKVKLGFQTQVCFQIGLHEKDRALLERIQSFFKGVGNISKLGTDLVQYRVSSIKDLGEIAEHFEN